MFNLRFALAQAGENYLARIAPGGKHAREFSARNDIEARAEARHQPEHREVRVCLHRICDQRLSPRERICEAREIGFDDGTRIDVTGCAELARDLLERHLFAAQRAGAVGKSHQAYFLAPSALSFSPASFG